MEIVCFFYIRQIYKLGAYLCNSLHLFEYETLDNVTAMLLSAYLNLFSLMALAVIKSAALSKPILPSLNTTAITPPHLTFNAWLNTNLSKALVPHGHPICTDDPQWQLPGDSGVGGYLGACHIALQELGNKEIISSVPCRFISATSVGRFQDPIVETPKRYTYTRKTQTQPRQNR